MLWTGRSADELLAMPDLVVARLPDGDHDPDLLHLVNRLQIHNCGTYCSHRRGSNRCRFGYPFDVNDEA